MSNVRRHKKNNHLNFCIQFYKGIPLQLIDRNYSSYMAKRYTINKTNQNVWIPNKHLEKDGTIKISENIDYVFRISKKQLEIAGITQAIPGIKVKSETHTNYG